jgi:hypothetical protein
MEEQNEREPSQLEMLGQVFREQLIACLEECSQGRRGLFSSFEALGDEAWPEADRLRELALALQGIFAQSEEPNPLCDEFLDLCSIHGESHPGEARLARALLQRIEKGEVGTQPEKEGRPW